jgi:aspartyl-tRNA(Asn)/glutamyl-tRNA(Gln) amidotransferase subunit C
MEFRDLQVTADLAHLNMDQHELRGAFGAFEEMLSFFAAMDSAGEDRAAFSAIEGSPSPKPTAPLDAAASTRFADSTCFRPDAPNPGHSGSGSLVEQMLDGAGERDGRFLVIPNVL